MVRVTGSPPVEPIEPILRERYVLVGACVRVGERLLRLVLDYAEEGARPEEWMSVFRGVIGSLKTTDEVQR